MRENLPLWKMAILATPDSFGVMPSDLPAELLQTAKNEPKNENKDLNAKPYVFAP